MPPQSTVRVSLLASQVPVQPVRFNVPSVSAAPEKLPSFCIVASPLIATIEPPVDWNCMPQRADCPWRMHCLAPMLKELPQPVASTAVIA